MSNDGMEDPVSTERNLCSWRGTRVHQREEQRAVMGKHGGQTLEQVGEGETQSRRRRWPQTARTHLPLKQEEVAGEGGGQFVDRDCWKMRFYCGSAFSQSYEPRVRGS